MAVDPDFRLPLSLRLLNRVGALTGGRWPRLDADRLWAAGAKAAGTDAPYPEAREALGVLLDELQGVASLTALGKMALGGELPVAIEQLLRVRAAVPEERPATLPVVVIASLPRSGTTLLHQLLSLHARARWPRMWELWRPWPAPRSLEEDPRVALAEARIAQGRQMMPELDKIHALSARGPDECYWLLAQTLCCAAFDAQLPVPRYMAWLLAQDLRWTYAHHRRALALLQQHVGGDFWLLKTPLHLFGLDALRETYPDARLVVIHREPREVAGSCCSLYESARAVYLSEVDPAALGGPWLEIWGTATDRAQQAMTRWDPQRLVRVSYQDLVRDPASTIVGLARRLGLGEDPGLASKVSSWVAEHPQHQHGAHKYTLERYGLRPEAVDERFAAWRGAAPDPEGAAS